MAVNQLLNAIEPARLKSFEHLLDRVELKPREVLIEPAMTIQYIFFPLNCMVSIVTPLENGSEIEAATVGNEGMVGLPLFFGLDEVNTRAICQMPGECLRMAADDFRIAVREEPSLRAALGLYTNAFIAMLGQGSACNGSHDVEQRLSRWLITIATAWSLTAFQLRKISSVKCWGCIAPQ